MLSPFFQRLPMWALVPIMLVVTGGMFFAIGFLTDRHEPLLAHAIGGVSYGVIFTAIFSIRIGIQRRRAGGAEEPARISTAVRTGRLPEDVDPSRWSPVLERQQTLFRRNRWTLPVMFIVFAALSIWLAATTSPLWFVFLVVFAALSVVSLFETRRALRNIPVLLDELARRPAPRASGDGAPQPTPGAHWPTPGER